MATTSTRELIAEDILSAVQSIATESGYHYNIGETGRDLKMADEVRRFPAAFVLSHDGENDEMYHDSHAVETMRMEVVVIGYVDRGINKDTRLNQLYSDIIKAVLADRERSRLAHYTRFLAVSSDVGATRDHGVIGLTFEVQYDFLTAAP